MAGACTWALAPGAAAIPTATSPTTEIRPIILRIAGPLPNKIRRANLPSVASKPGSGVAVKRSRRRSDWAD